MDKVANIAQPSVVIGSFEKIACVIAIVAALTTAIFDQAANFDYVAGSFSDERRQYLFALGELPAWRFVLATYGGAFIFPFFAGGFWMLYRAMAPAGLFWSAIPIGLCVYFVLTINPAIHNGWGYMGLLSRNFAGSLPQGMEGLVAAYLSFDFVYYALFKFGYAIIAVWISIPILFNRTNLPRWSALFTPLITVPIWQCLRLIFPDLPIAIYNLILGPDICVAALFILSLISVEQKTNHITYKRELRSL